MSLDTKIAQYHRPKAGAFGPPATGAPLTAADAGLLAINFAGHTAADKAAGNKPAIYSFNGAAWEHLNDVAAISTQTIDLTTGAAAADIGAKYAVASPALTGDVIIATYGTPAGAFLLTNKSAPQLAASWTALGSATAVATAGEASAGADNAKMITSAVLRTELTRLLGGTSAKTASITTTGGNGVADAGKILILNAAGGLPAGALPIATSAEMTAGSADNKISTPLQLRTELARVLGIATADLLAGGVGIATGGGVAGAAGKVPLLDAGGHIDASFLGIQGLNFIGGTDMAAAIPAPPAAGYQNGDVYTHTGAAGATPNAVWTFGADVTGVEPGDMAIYDGATWHHIATAADLSNVVLKAGANAMAADAALNWTDPGVADTVIIDGAVAVNAVIDHVTLKNSVIGGGTF